MHQGYLFPSFHQNYWIGLTSNNSAYPRFTWLDITLRPPGVQGAYRKWGEQDDWDTVMPRWPRRARLAQVQLQLPVAAPPLLAAASAG